MGNFASFYTAPFALDIKGVLKFRRHEGLMAFGKTEDGGFTMPLGMDGHAKYLDILTAKAGEHVTHCAALPGDEGKNLLLLQTGETSKTGSIICLQNSQNKIEWSSHLSIKNQSGASILVTPDTPLESELAGAVLTPTRKEQSVGFVVTLIADNGREAVSFEFNLPGPAIPKCLKFMADGTVAIGGAIRFKGQQRGFILNANLLHGEGSVTFISDAKRAALITVEDIDTKMPKALRASGSWTSGRGAPEVFEYQAREDKRVRILEPGFKQKTLYISCDRGETFVSSDTSKAGVMSYDTGSNRLFRAPFELETTLTFSGSHLIDGQRFAYGRSAREKKGAIISFGAELECCCLGDVTSTEASIRPITSNRYPVKTSKQETSFRATEVRQKRHKLKFEDICKNEDPTRPSNWPPQEDVLTEPFKMGDDVHIQSPLLGLEAAGSTGTAAARGILTRWSLMGELGEHHLPKGNESAGPPRRTGDGLPIFNRPGDFVKLYRFAKPQGEEPHHFDLLSQIPDVIDDVAAKWGYSFGGETVYLYFKDKAQYAALRNQYDPKDNTVDFLRAVTGTIEVAFDPFISYKVAIAFSSVQGAPQNSAIRYAAGSSLDPYANPERVVETVARGSTSINQSPISISAPNITSIFFNAAYARLTGLKFYTYRRAFIAANRQNLIQPLGKFALSTQDTTVFSRFDTAEPDQVHDNWSKFSNPAKVNIQNYKDRWSDSDKGLRQAVTTYLTLSETDPRAIDDFIDDPLPGMQSAKTTLSYLDILRLASSDFHIARGLGLGYVDSSVAGQTTEYFYFVAYEVELGLGLPNQRRLHISMSQPTRPSVQRLPSPPSDHKLSYGLPVTTAGNSSYSLTDADGYTPDGEARYIRHAIKHDLYHFDAALDPTTGVRFSLGTEQAPSFFFMNYRRQGAAQWSQPGVGYDRVYKDTQNFPEQLPSAFKDDPEATALIHKEIESGEHEYAAASIDIFSRASLPGLITPTDKTVLRQPNRLLPPSDFRVQLIQQESKQALLLTTAREQLALEALQDSDKTLVRVHFNYNHIQERNYCLPQSWRQRNPAPAEVFADKVDIFFRPEMPRTVEGQIQLIEPWDNGGWILHSQSVTLASTGETLTPLMPQSLVARFMGAALVYDQKTYIIEDILFPVAAPNDPIFKVRPQDDDGVSINDGGSQNIMTVDNFNSMPDAGRHFLAVENMAEPDNWEMPNPLSLTVDISDQNWDTREEIITDALGNDTKYFIRGFWETGQLIDMGNSEYKLEFDNFIRPPHSQDTELFPGAGLSKVSYFKGTVRAKLAGSTERRDLRVFAEDWTGAKGKLFLRDEATVSSQGGTTPKPLDMGASIEFNYYPSYSAYLLADLPSGLNAETILPEKGEGIRQSILGVCSRDIDVLDVNSQPYTSAMSVPASLLALEIRKPKTPLAPTSLGYATPPDNQDKSSLRLGLDFPDPDHDPFAVIMLRTDSQSVLSALYGQKTRQGEMTIDNGEDVKIDGVADIIFPRSGDSSFEQRFAEIFAIRDDGPYTFSALPLADGSLYTLPKPDAPELIEADAKFILSALYKPQTRLEIEAKIFPGYLDQSSEARLAELIAVRSGPIPTFSDLPLSDEPGGLTYQLPAPDSPNLTVHHTGTGLIAAFDAKDGKYLQEALRQRFLPLSEQPILFDEVPQWHSGHRPHKGPQIVKDATGNPLTPVDSNFDISPMAVRFECPDFTQINAMSTAAIRDMLTNLNIAFSAGNSKAILIKKLLRHWLTKMDVDFTAGENNSALSSKIEAFYADKPRLQFVDFTLSGSKHPDAVYFYAAQELGNRMDMSGLSGVHGPVKMVNTRSPEPPLVTKVLSDNLALTPPSVRFHFAIPAEYEDVTGIRIYRSTSGIKAQSLRQMTLIHELAIAEAEVDSDPNSHSLIAYDRFNDGHVPFGDPLFYRIAFIRYAPYIDDTNTGQIATVLSKPSRVFLTNVADPIPPYVDAPRVSFVENGTNQDQIDVTLEWDKAAHNCTYYPSLMSREGIWQRLGEMTGNDDILQYPQADNLVDTITLPKTDDYGEAIDYQFKIDSVNASGLINKTHNINSLIL